MKSLDIEIREYLVHYLANEIAIQAFEDWFVPATWEVEKTGNTIAIELTNEIDLRLAEFSSGHWTEAELREKLRPLIQQYTVNIHLGTSSSPKRPSRTSNIPCAASRRSTRLSASVTVSIRQTRAFPSTLFPH